MQGFLDGLLHYLSLPQYGLTTLFIVAFVSATLLPLGSEPALFGYVTLNPDQAWLAIGVATVGNTFGGLVNYAIGRGGRHLAASDGHEKYLRWFERLGPRLLFFSFLPVVGDPLCAVAGWIGTPIGPTIAWSAAGRLVRYVVMTFGLLGLPDGFWQSIASVFR